MNGTVTPSACAALTSPEHRLITVIGAGGKTSLLHWIAKSRISAGQRVVITTTTKIFPLHDVDTILMTDGPDFLNRMRQALTKSPCVIAAQRFDTITGKLIGLDPESVDALHYSEIADAILVEADGAARKPLKAPARHEPVIPTTSNICVGIMGLDAVNQPFSENVVHRPNIFAEITGISHGEKITPVHMIKIATASEGLFKGCPQNCERSVLLNKIDIPGGKDLVAEFTAKLNGSATTSTLSWFAGSCRQHCLHRINYQSVMSCAKNNHLEHSYQF